MYRIDSSDKDLVLQFGAVVPRSVNETPSFGCTAIDDLNNINEVLPVGDRKCDLIIVPSAHVDHDVLVSVEEHDRAWVC